jgi:hypothetical protein
MKTMITICPMQFLLILILILRAFSATEAIESQWFLAGNKLIDLAPQQIVDCDQGRGDQVLIHYLTCAI